MNVGIFTRDGLMHITDNFDTSTPTWATVDLKALGMRGDLQDTVVDPFSPRYKGEGDELRAWVETDVEIGKLVDNGTDYTYTVIQRKRLLHRLYLNVRKRWELWRYHHRYPAIVV